VSWTDIFLGVIAATMLVTAIIQIGVLVAARRLAMRLVRLTDRVEHEMKPVFAHLDVIGREAARAATLATAQVERADGLFADMAGRVVDSMDSVQRGLAAPARQGAALLAGFRAALASLRNGRSGRSRPRGEDEDALFV
jgi:hypothetical protein